MPSGEYEFSKKPWRMTSPPANQSKWLVGFSGTHCRLELDPQKVAILAREATWGSVYDFELTPEVVEGAMKDIKGGKILGAAYEMPALAFVMRGSRCTMDQLLRLRESAGASHTTRDNDFRDFNIIVPETIENLRTDLGDDDLYDRVTAHIQEARRLYGEMVDSGKVPPQDARYIALPMGYQGDWIQIMNMRALIKECEQRLCNGMTQHESNYMVRMQRDLVVAKYPHMDKMLRSSCEKRGECASRSMLFPACGAFGPAGYDDDVESNGLVIHRYDPDQHLYSNDLNTGMQMAHWDKDRQKLERENPDVIYCMDGPPMPLEIHEESLV